MIAVTGASGQLGRLVIESLLARGLPASEVIAAVRNPEKVKDLQDQGIAVRVADYTEPTSLTSAFKGVEKVLLISSNELGQRVPQHRNVIDAAKDARVELIAYTSILRADTSPLGLAEEHRRTEEAIHDSGIPSVILRNGWYTENYLASVPTSVQQGAFVGSAGEGRIASSARADYAQAAAIVLTSPGHTGKVYELAGDSSYTLGEFAARLSALVGKTIPYVDLTETEFREVLLSAGLPAPLAELIANSDVGASKGALYDDRHQLSALIGRPTTPLSYSLAVALQS